MVPFPMVPTASSAERRLYEGFLSQLDDGYVVELSIPWASFGKAKRVPPAPKDVWRMNFYAIENNGGVAWSPILGQGNFHLGSRFGRVRFSK